MNYDNLAPFKLILLDVDLYLPTKKTLPKIYDLLVDGGIVVVDDVQDNMNYDGAYQAYMEFVTERHMNPDIVGNKCGIMYKGKS